MIRPGLAAVALIVLAFGFQELASGQEKAGVAHRVVRMSEPNAVRPVEVSVAINPTDPDHIVAASQQGANNVVYVSKDAGRTWKTVGTSNANKRIQGDDAVTFAADGLAARAYISFVGIRDPRPKRAANGIFIATSKDGLKWGDPVPVIDHVNTVTPMEDKPWIRFDTNKDSKHKGNLYVAWTRFDEYGSKAPEHKTHIYLSRSKDNGTTFSVPHRISENPGDCLDKSETVMGAIPAVGPKGEVYVVWAGPKGLSFVKSTNGGYTFGKEKVLTATPGAWDFDVKGIMRCNGMPSVGVDLSDGPNRGTIHVNWADKRNGDPDIFHMSSADGGETWTKPLRVNDDPKENRKEQFFTWMAVDPVDGSVNVVFFDRRDSDDTKTRVTLARSIDGGKTFVNHKVDQEPFACVKGVFFGDYIGIDAYGGRIVAAYQHFTKGPAVAISAAIFDFKTGSQEVKAAENDKKPADPTAFINQELAKRWEAEKLTPAARTNELEFLRRASLDLIGRIPTIKEQQTYMSDAPRDRRRVLVDRLLAHDDYARHWADVWTHWLLGPFPDTKGRPAFHGWLQQHFAKNGSHKDLAEKLLTAKGSPGDNPAVHFFVAHRGQPIPKKNWAREGQYDMMPLTGQVFRVLHGRRLQCIQCHDHAFDGDITQHHFFQANIFFRQVGFTNDGISDDPTLNENGQLPFQRLHGPILFDKPRFGGETWAPTSKQTRREFFAERFVKHPQFARAYVNFIWAELFGHGLTKEDFDDMDGHNPVVHKALLDRLAAEFVKSGHDPKALLRWICNSDAYALKSVANKTNASADKAVFVSRTQVRPLARRVLVESLVVALTTTDYVERRGKLREELLREIAPAAPPDMTHCDILPLNVEELSIQQVLWLTNSSALNRELTDPKGTVPKAIQRAKGASAKTFPTIATELFAITLCRPPTPAELERLGNPMNVRNVPEPEFWRSYCEDIFWALLNTNEFGSNH